MEERNGSGIRIDLHYQEYFRKRKQKDKLEITMKFEWDIKKAKSNLRKHKVSFEEAATALSDSMAATGADPDHSFMEQRYVTFGISERGRLIVVSHTEKNDAIRIISARIASKGERKIYEEG